jgi:microcystin-dependent protein
MDPFIGTILAFGFNYEPEGWFICDGRLLQIAQYQALYALLGVYYGGDGRTTFAIPDLRGRTVIGWTNSAAPGITSNVLGQKSGAEKVQLAANQIPSHTHSATATGQGTITGSITAVMNVNNTSCDQSNPDGNYLGPETTGGGLYSTTKDAGKTLKSDAISVNSGGLAVGLSGLAVTVMPTPVSTDNVPVTQPSLVLNYCIAYTGIFPPRQ